MLVELAKNGIQKSSDQPDSPFIFVVHAHPQCVCCRMLCLQRQLFRLGVTSVSTHKYRGLSSARYSVLFRVDSLNSCPVVYATNGYVTSLKSLNMLPILPANCFVLPVVSSRSVSRAYSPPTKLPIEHPPIPSTGIPYSSKACKNPMCEIPLAPPPPSTTPICLPVSRRAIRAKSFMCAGRRGRRGRSPRYFLIRVSTFSRRCLKAATAAGSCTVGVPLWGVITPGSST